MESKKNETLRENRADRGGAQRALNPRMLSSARHRRRGWKRQSRSSDRAAPKLADRIVARATRRRIHPVVSIPRDMPAPQPREPRDILVLRNRGSYRRDFSPNLCGRRCRSAAVGETGDEFENRAPVSYCSNRHDICRALLFQRPSSACGPAHTRRDQRRFSRYSEKRLQPKLGSDPTDSAPLADVTGLPAGGLRSPEDARATPKRPSESVRSMGADSADRLDRALEPHTRPSIRPPSPSVLGQ